MAGKKKSPAKKLNKSAFIRSMPDAPAKTVVAKGKEKGLQFSEGYVYTVRSSSKGARKASSKGPRESAAPRVDGGTSNKRAFITSLPRTMSAAQVVAEGKKKGIVLSPGYVYVVRSTGGGGARGARRSDAGSRAAGGGSPEKGFVTLVAEIGVGRAQALLDRFRQKLGTFDLS